MKKVYLLLIGITLICSISFAQTPYAYYSLASNPNDSTSNHLNGTVFGNPTPTTNQNNIQNAAFLFNGSTDYISLPAIFDFPSRTVMTWLRASNLGGFENVIYMADNSNVLYGQTSIVTRDSSNVLELILTCDQFQWIQHIDTGIWYQPTIVRSPNAVKFFVNGVLVQSSLNPSGLHSNNQTTFNAVIGADRNYSVPFNGKIDDLAIYNTALSDTIVRGIYTSISEVNEIKENLKTYTTAGNVFVELPENLQSHISSIALYDIMGKEISIKEGSLYNGKINSSPLANGVYIVAVYSVDQAQPVSRKVVVDK